MSTPFRPGDGSSDTPPDILGKGTGQSAENKDEDAAVAAAAAALREHLSDIGVGLALPSKRPTRATGVQAVQAAPPPPPRFRRYIAAAIVAVGLSLALIEYWPESPGQVPAGLMGEWASNHPDFVGRRMAFTAQDIAIAISDSTPPVHYPIIRVRSTLRPDALEVGITYLMDGGEVEFHAKLIPGNQLVLDRPSGVIFERPDALAP